MGKFPCDNLWLTDRCQGVSIRNDGGLPVRLASLSLAAKLYAIFGLLASVTVALVLVAVANSQRHAALTAEFESAFLGSMNVERVNALIYAVVMESRGIYMSPDVATAKRFGDGLLKFNARIGDVVKEWQGSVAPHDRDRFDAFAKRIGQFQEFRRELVRRGTEISPAAGREWGDNEANRSVRSALNKDIDELAKLYAARSQAIYAQVETGIGQTAFWMALLGAAALLLAGIGAILIWRSLVRQLAGITRVTQAIAAGENDVAVPYQERRDEIGRLALSVAVFEQAMRRNDELARTVSSEGEARARRQEITAHEIDRFSTDVESTLAQLSSLAEGVRKGSQQMAAIVATGSDGASRATAASAEASSNVRDIASAAEELNASVMEIDRQVAQSHAIALKAVNEAESTTATVKELSEAAGRIGDVVRLITAIAEQTNLLALNATIEAARAGDAGRGFAVVAGEVKALAGQTQKATEEISAQIKGMQQVTDRSIAAIATIEATIRDIGSISGAIAAAVTEQGAATQEIARSVETAARRTAETAEQMQHLNGATEQTSQQAAAARKVADELGSAAAHIRKQVDLFFERLRAA